MMLVRSLNMDFVDLAYIRILLEHIWKLRVGKVKVLWWLDYEGYLQEIKDTKEKNDSYNMTCQKMMIFLALRYIKIRDFGLEYYDSHSCVGGELYSLELKWNLINRSKKIRFWHNVVMGRSYIQRWDFSFLTKL